MSSTTTLALDPLELAMGQVLGGVTGGAHAGRSRRGRSRAVLEGLVLDALLRPPCAVSFSGGRDSSTLLALAVFLARREGLELPVALTLVFPDVSSTDEHEWQQHVLSDLGDPSWERVTIADELDYVGPYAERSLVAHGVVFPGNAYVHLPLLDLVPGGSLLCGAGGDEVLGNPAEHFVRVLTLGARPVRGDLGQLRTRVARDYAQILGRRAVSELAWVRPDAIAMAAEREGKYLATLGSRWGSGLRRWSASRYCVALRSSLISLGNDTGVRTVLPFLDPRFLSAWAADGGIAGPRDRSAALELLVGDLLPAAVRERRSKAEFGAAFFTERSRSLAAEVDPSCFDPELVDGAALVDLWRGDRLDGRTTLLLQALALSQLEQRIDRLG